jgi:branched-chain amino acid transport system ATP-binding protein
MLRVFNLMVFFENARAINDFSMEVREGELVGILGPNSAGKTTLMNSISGLLVDIRTKEMRRGGERISIYGTISFKDEDITWMDPSLRVKRGIVLCRERHPIFKESSVMENLRIAGYLQPYSQVQRMVEYSLTVFPSLQRLRHKKAGFLSGGEQQMLAVGMALVARPRLLLLDEPLLGLSPMIQRQLMDTVVGLRKELSLTVVIAEQFARPVLPVIDRGYVIENGILTVTGTGAELMDNPEVKAAYLGG